MNPELFALAPWAWALTLLCAMMVGFAKSGVPGVAILCVPIMATIFPAGPSTGIYLPMLIAGDIFAVAYYRRDAQWEYALKPLSWAAAGIVLATLVIRQFELSDAHLKRMIGAIVLLVLGLGLYVKRHRENLNVPKSWWFVGIIGMLGGFTTMVANAAGPIWIVYLLALQLPKKTFLGTNAWVFLILNIFKVPFSLYLGFIGVESLWFDLKMVPAVAAGAFLGVHAAKFIRQEMFETLVRILAVIGALQLLLA